MVGEGGQFSGRQFSSGAFVRGAIIRGQLYGGQFSSEAVALETFQQYLPELLLKIIFIT